MLHEGINDMEPVSLPVQLVEESWNHMEPAMPKYECEIQELFI